MYQKNVFPQDAAKTACPSVESQVTFKCTGEGGQWWEPEHTSVVGQGEERELWLGLEGRD
jgi:hypothetical protein